MIPTGTLSRSATGNRTVLSRVTLVGERRRVDLVLPSLEPVGVLLPEIMRLLDDRVGARPESRHLVTADGSALEPDSSLASAGVPDGAVLRLVRMQDAPSAPVVHEVSDEVADDLDVRAWRWRPAVRRIVAGAATVFWAVAAGVLARGEFDLAAVGAGLLAAAGVGALAGVLCGRVRRQGLAITLIVTAGALGALGVWACADAYGWSGPQRLAGLAVSVATALVLAGWFTPLGRGALFGAGSVGGCLVLWEVAVGLQDGAGSAAGQARAGALLAAFSIVVLGVLPRLALMASGLTGLGDRRTGGASVSRYQVATALAATHRGLAIATVVLAASAAVAGVMVLRSVSVWTVLLCVMVMVALRGVGDRRAGAAARGTRAESAARGAARLRTRPGAAVGAPSPGRRLPAGAGGHGRRTRSIGVHLLLSSQRIEGGKLKGLDTYLSYRLGLRTFSADESRTVLDTTDAFHVPPLPGFGYLKVDTSTYERFKAGYVSGAYKGPALLKERDDEPLARPYPTYNTPQEAVAAEEPVATKRETGPTVLSVMVGQLATADYEILTAAGQQPLAPFLPYLSSAQDIGLHFVLARRTAGASRALYEPLLTALRETGTTALVMTGERTEGQLFPGLYASQQPSGRGTLVRRGRPHQLIQTALTAEEADAE